MGSGGGVNTEDKAYNARMASLSEEQQGWASQMFNTFMYGVGYNPSEERKGYYGADGKFVDLTDEIKAAYDPNGTVDTRQAARDVLKEHGFSGKEIETISNGGTVGRLMTTTQGDLNNYNSEDYISEQDLMTKQIQDAFGLTDDETNALRSGFNLTEAQNKAGMETLPSQTEATIAGNELSTASSEAAQTVIPSQTEAAISGNQRTTAQNTADIGLIPQRAELESSNIGEAQQQISARAPIIDKYYQEAGKEINVNDRMNEASADVAQAAGAQRASLGRNIALRGGNINSGSGRSIMTDLANNTIKADAYARTNARRSAETEQLNRYRDAMTLGDV